MNALITGINGFAGSFLAEALLEKGIGVSGIIQPGTDLSNISHIQDRISSYEIDILDKEAVDRTMISAAPDLVFHLAGISNVKFSFDHPDLTFRTNVSGTETILDSTKRNAKGCRVLVVSSAEVYGNSDSGEAAADESFPFSPANPYSKSKAAADELSRRYAAEHGMDIVVARPSNHIGPRQSDMFFVPTVAKQVAMVMKGKKEPVLELGNIDVYRDLCDVRDVVRAYMMLADKGESGEAYNICSGKKRLLREIAERLIGLSGHDIGITIDPAKLRKNDRGQLNISNQKLNVLTGWRQIIDIDDTLKDILNYWADRV